MRRVSKSKAAALEAEARGTQKRKSTKAAAYAEDDAGDETDGEDINVKPAAQEQRTKDKNVKRKAGKSDPADADDESDEAESFEVEAILSSRARHGKRQFKIRWKGYGPADDTWEDEENIDSPELVAAFLKGPPENGNSSKVVKKPLKKRGGTASAKSPPKKVKADHDSEENAEWEVSKIVDFVNLKDGTRQFLVQWKGYSSKANTWEPEANLNCPELIEKFLANENEREESTREMREVRKQVFKYNPELTKRSSGRAATRKRISYHDLE